MELMDISIKWKLFASFSLSMLMPFMAVKLGIPVSISIICGLVTILLLTWYSYYRILNALATIRENLQPLYQVGKDSPLSSTIQDELTAAMMWSDRLMESVEASISKFSDEAPTKPSFELGSRHEFQGQLSSGDSIYGEVLNYISLGNAGYSIPHYEAAKNEELFLQSVQGLKERLTEMRDLVKNPQVRGIVDFQIYFLDDPNFLQGFKENNAKGLSLEVAIESLFQDFVQRLEKVENELVRSRVKDLVDLKSQVLQEMANLVSEKVVSEHHFEGKILLVSTLMPSHVLRYHRGKVKGIVSREGTPSSHAQILLESLGLPSISELDMGVELPDGENVLLNVVDKKVITNPEQGEIERSHKVSERLKNQFIQKEGVQLSSGEPIAIKANLNVAHDVGKAVEYGADGIGLFRSEIAYLGMRKLPSEDELFRSYLGVTEAYPQSSVTFRMLDIGGDKLVGLSGSGKSKEENPCMGNRSMRLLNSNLDLFRAQFRAMRRAAHAKTSIIFPMVNGVDELNGIMDRVEEYESELVAEMGELVPVKYGIMVEVPSIVECFESIVDRFDFFNIGTNDLTQYTLAADRNNQDVSAYYSSFHPAILKMIEKICRLGYGAEKEVCLCGEIASDLSSMPLWVGLGVRQFSVPYRYVPSLKARVASLDLEECRSLAKECLSVSTTKEVKRLVQKCSLGQAS
jgi:phosphoenolpyruvate-protein phosphotransferase